MDFFTFYTRNTSSSVQFTYVCRTYSIVCFLKHKLSHWFTSCFDSRGNVISCWSSPIRIHWSIYILCHLYPMSSTVPYQVWDIWQFVTDTFRRHVFGWDPTGKHQLLPGKRSHDLIPGISGHLSQTVCPTGTSEGCAMSTVSSQQGITWPIKENWDTCSGYFVVLSWQGTSGHSTFLKSLRIGKVTFSACMW